MEATTIKWIDVRIGSFSCRLLTWWRRLGGRLDRKSKATPEKIFFIKLIEQGATVLAYSALKRAVEKVGKDNVYFVVFSENRPILDFIDILKPENIFEIRNDHFGTFVIDFFKTLLKLRKHKVDACIDMEFFSRGAAIYSFLSGAKHRVGLHSFTSEHPYRGDLMTHKIHYNPYVHVSRYYLMEVEALFENSSEQPALKQSRENFSVEPPRLQLPPEEVTALKEKVQHIYGKPIDGPLIILNPNASDMLPLRKWDTEKFGALAREIESNYPNALIAFTGVGKERPAVSALIEKEQLRQVVNLAGETSLRELMCLYQWSDLVVTNDSGPAHFASMFDVGIIVLFGPETPQLFGPLGDKVEVIWKRLACSPCVNVFNHRFSPCKNNLCMQTIEVDEVFDKVKKSLN